MGEEGKKKGGRAKAARDTRDDAASFKKKDLYDAVQAGTDLNGKQARAGVDAMLAAIRAAVEGGREVILPPFAKIKEVRRLNKAGVEKVNYKLRLAGGGNDKAALEDAED